MRLPSSAALTALMTAWVLATPACAAPATTPGTMPKVRVEPGSSGLAGAFLSARHAEAGFDNTTATQFLQRALTIDPDNQALLRQAYFVAAQAGNFDEAIQAASRATSDTSAQRDMAPLIIAIGQYKKGEYEQAWTTLSKLSAQGAVGFALPMLRAWAAAPRSPADKALAELAPLQAPGGTPDLGNMMAGLLNEYYGRNADALASYDVLAARVDQLPLSVLRVVAGGYDRLGKAATVKELTAKFRAAHGGSPLSDDYLDAFADPKRQPKKVTPQDGMAEAMFAAAQMLALSQTATPSLASQLAVLYGQGALYLNPNLDIARRVIGSALAARGRFDEANTILGTIKKGDPGYVAVQMQIADNYERMDKPADALALLQRIAREEPSWPEPDIAIGDHMRREKKFADAVDAYDRAFKLMPKGESDSWQLYYARGIALERTKQFDRAYADFRKAIALNPNDASVLNYLGYSLVERGVDLPEGRALIEKAVKLRPEDGYIIDSLGWAMYLMGETDQAVRQLEKAVQSDPSDPTINEHLGDAYWKVGRRQEAMFQWRRALTLEPEDTQRSEIQGKLAQGLARNDAAATTSPAQ